MGLSFSVTSLPFILFVFMHFKLNFPHKMSYNCDNHFYYYFLAFLLILTIALNSVESENIWYKMVV